MKKKRKKVSKQPEKKFGGLSFFSNVVACACLTFLAFSYLVTQATFSAENALRAMIVGGVATATFFISQIVVRYHLHIIIHEYKHLIFARLAGNTTKAFVVKAESGSVEYSYTKDTAHFNALINLAPYIMPLGTLIGIVIGYTLFHGRHELVVACAACGLGFDISLNIRDLSPVQTDLTDIRGGFLVATICVFFINLSWMTLVLMWALFDVAGLKEFAYFSYGLGLALIQKFR